MRSIVSPLSGIRSPFGLRDGASVYAILGFDPALVFDFVGNYFRKGSAASTFGASITHARASSATMMNSSGALVTVGNNVPRTGHHIYNGSAWVNEGILHESEARTNLLTDSNDFAAWAKTNLTATVNQATGPDGTVSATEIGVTSIPSNSYAIKNATNTSGTLSYFVKQNTERFFIIVRGAYASGDWAIFDLSTGTVSKSPTHSGSSTEMVPMGNGWYRCVLQSTQSSNINAFSISGSGTDNTTVTSGTVYLWGAQFEAGSTPSSYIPTTSASVTRAAETLTVPAANLPYNSTNMSIQIDGKMNYADRTLIREVQFVEWLADSNNGIEQFACSGTGFFPNGAVAFFQEAAATTSLRVTPVATLPFGVNVPFNISSRHGSTFLNGAVGGTALTADTTPTALPNLSSTNLNLGQAFMGTIRQYRMWSDDITDAGITEAST